MHLSAVSTRRLGAVTAAWGIAFAAVHVYWAAGGTIAYDSNGQSGFDSLYIGFVALIGLASAAIALGLCQAWGIRVGRNRLRLLARAGGTLLGLGVALGVGRWVVQASIGDDGADGVAITAYFLVGSVLFSALGWLGLSPRCDDATSAAPRTGVPA
jgi:hypothetical protein